MVFAKASNTVSLFLMLMVVTVMTMASLLFLMIRVSLQFFSLFLIPKGSLIVLMFGVSQFFLILTFSLNSKH